MFAQYLYIMASYSFIFIGMYLHADLIIAGICIKRQREVWYSFKINHVDLFVCFRIKVVFQDVMSG